MSGVIRVSADGYLASYIRYAQKLVSEEKLTSFQLTGTGTALENCVRVAELLKRVYPEAHRLVTIGLRDFAKTEGSNTRTVPYVEITFIISGPVDKTQPGYHAPLPQAPENIELMLEDLKNLRGRRPRRREDQPNNQTNRRPRAPRLNDAPIA